MSLANLVDSSEDENDDEKESVDSDKNNVDSIDERDVEMDNMLASIQPGNDGNYHYQMGFVEEDDLE